MQYLLTSANVADVDKEMMTRYNLTEVQLMETASQALFDGLTKVLTRCYDGCHKIAVVCGNGNNGGDGMCLARHLAKSFDVSLIWHGDASRLSLANVYNYKRLPPNVQQYTPENANELNPSLIIDAVLGVGAKLPIRAPASQLLSWIKGHSCPIISIDVPSGIEANSGKADDLAVHATHTITLLGPKVGMIMGQGALCSGKIESVDFGVPTDVIQSVCSIKRCNDEDLINVLPERKSKSSKFDFGRVAVIGGTLGMRGAPSLTAHAAIALGAGLVDLIAPAIHPLTPREIITHQVDAQQDGTISPKEFERILTVLTRATVVAIGPGVGSNSGTIEMLARCIESVSKSITILLDAEGISCVKHLRDLSNVIITPHMGELSRLLSTPKNELESTYVDDATAWAKDHGAVVHVKNVPSVTTNGTTMVFLNAGTPAMATAGSGDVLTGIIASLCAQGLDRLDATSKGAYLHAKAGEAIVRSGRRRLLAHELITAACKLV